jgi:AraC-like DNA-binding protein
VKSTTIPMTHAAGMGPLPALLVATSGSSALKRVLQAARLPLDIGARPKMRIPVSSLVEVFERAAIEAGERCFGLRVGQEMDPRSFGTWAVYCLSAATLGAAIQRFARGLRLYQAGAESFLQTSGERAIWGYRRPCRRTDGLQHADHVLPPMIKLVQAYLGDSWHPELVHVCYARDASAEQLEQALGTTVMFDAPGIAVTFDKAALCTSRRQCIGIEEQLTMADVFADVFVDSTADAKTTVGAVRDILRTRALRGEFDLAGTARIAGIGPRSLQRQLQSRGLSYRSLVDEVCMKRAIGLLIETDHPIAAIAFSLGYIEPGNFTRAFRRVTGHSPQQYRRTAASN